MSYLQPPPNLSPVVVVKDFGGYVNEYAAQTEIYRRTGREVRIHECHSACTMALGLPNVCVYKDSVFKFHQAYDPRNHITNWQVTGELYDTYPAAVRDRLGAPSKSFTVMRGTELIDLGIRDCSMPNPRIMVASASAKPIPDGLLGGGGAGWSALTGRLGGLIPNLGIAPEPAGPGSTGAGKPVKRATPAVPVEMLAVPLPPEKPGEGVAPDAPLAPGEVPLPPPRPKVLVAYVPSLPPIPFMQRIDGSQAILPSRFVPFPKRAI